MANDGMADGFRLDPDGGIRSVLLERMPWLEHSFGTRHSAPVTAPAATLKQVHSAEVLEAGGRGRECGGEQGEADALVSNTPGLAVAVKTADCVPILLADANRRVVAAVHAGWRGTVKQIVRLAVEHMAGNYGSEPKDIFAAIGPAIGKCCFEVGPEVAREFVRWSPELARTSAQEHLDLEAVNAAELVAAGVWPEHVARSGVCTVCRNDLLFSFRKEREAAGRMYSWIRIRSGI